MKHLSSGLFQFENKLSDPQLATCPNFNFRFCECDTKFVTPIRKSDYDVDDKMWSSQWSRGFTQPFRLARYGHISVSSKTPKNVRTQICLLAILGVGSRGSSDPILVLKQNEVDRLWCKQLNVIHFTRNTTTRNLHSAASCQLWKVVCFDMNKCWHVSIVSNLRVAFSIAFFPHNCNAIQCGRL